MEKDVHMGERGTSVHHLPRSACSHCFFSNLSVVCPFFLFFFAFPPAATLKSLVFPPHPHPPTLALPCP